MKEFALLFALTGVSVFLLTVLAERILIPILRSHKLGQKILDIGPRWHKSKEGTPIMGGIGFILSTMLVMAAFFLYEAFTGDPTRLIPLAMTLAFSVGHGAIGFVDDYCKLIKKENEGLTWIQKLVLQFAVSGAYVAVMGYTGQLSTVLRLPFIGVTWEMGWLFYPVAVLVLTGVVNGGNITDGIDGLASSVSAVAGGFFAVLAFAILDEGLAVTAAALLGGTLGFLVYNFHPARVFMGDTGSLFLGALIMGTAFSLGESIVGLILCGVFILEMLSSLLQVVYFKLTHGKRFFKMAPIHHHFEKCGWSEVKIVAVFSAVELIFCLVAWFALQF